MCNNSIGVFEYQINKLNDEKEFHKIKYTNNFIDIDKQIHLMKVRKIYEIWERESQNTSIFLP